MLDISNLKIAVPSAKSLSGTWEDLLSHLSILEKNDSIHCATSTCTVTHRTQAPHLSAGEKDGQGQKKGIRCIDFHDVIECLIVAVEARDPYTSGHSSRVADVSLLLADGMGLTDPQREIVHMAAHMHDIGKIGIPDEVLSKAGRLNDEEWGIVRRHPLIGYDILSRAEALMDIAVVVRHHHERCDGKGYPDGLKGNEIPIGSRIIAVADAIDAMLSERSYRKAMTLEACARELTLHQGTQFDGDIAAMALRYMRENADFFTKFPEQRYPYDVGIYKELIP